MWKSKIDQVTKLISNKLEYRMSTPQTEAQGEMDKPKALGSNGATERKENTELEEMTIGEIAPGTPSVDFFPNIRIQAWKVTDKINKRLTLGEIDYHILHFLLSELREFSYDIQTRLGLSKNLAISKFKKVFEFTLKIIETAHCKSKRGCDVNVILGRCTTPLNEAIRWWRDNEFGRNEAIHIVQALISAGAKFNTFDITTIPPGLKKYTYFFGFDALKIYANEVHEFLTPLDNIMRRILNHGRVFDDFYSITRWDPSQEIPVDLINVEMNRLILKAIYQQCEFISDRHDMSTDVLQMIIEAQAQNAFPKGINAIIIAYAAPLIADLRTLSCFARERDYYFNIWYIGKHILIEDQQREAVLGQAERVASQQASPAAQVCQASPAVDSNHRNLTLTPMYSTTQQAILSLDVGDVGEQTVVGDAAVGNKKGSTHQQVRL